MWLKYMCLQNGSLNKGLDCAFITTMKTSCGKMKTRDNFQRSSVYAPTMLRGNKCAKSHVGIIGHILCCPYHVQNKLCSRLPPLCAHASVGDKVTG